MPKLNENTAAVNAVMTAPSTANMPATDATCVSTATATSSTNNETLQPLPFTYSHKEVQLLLENAKLNGYQEGFEEGHRTGKKTGIEEGKEEGHNKGHMEGYKYGYDACQQIGEQRQEEAHKKGQLEGYGIGLREGYNVGLKKGEENRQTKEKDEGNWKHGYSYCVLVEEGHLRLVMEVAKAMASKEADPTTRSDASTQVAPTTDETASQTNGNTECQCIALQTEPLDDDSPSSLKDTLVVLCVNFDIQTTTKPTGPAAQIPTDLTTFITSSPSPPNITMSPIIMATQPASMTTALLTTTTSTPSPASKLPPAPHK